MVFGSISLYIISISIFHIWEGKIAITSVLMAQMFSNQDQYNWKCIFLVEIHPSF